VAAAAATAAAAAGEVAAAAVASEAAEAEAEAEAGGARVTAAEEEAVWETQAEVGFWQVCTCVIFFLNLHECK
jgi:hypothetical protein